MLLAGGHAMLTKLFEAKVVNGQLHHQETLVSFEGQAVGVTLMAPPPCRPIAEPADPSAAGEPAEGLDVEKEIYVPMPFRSEVVGDMVVMEEGRLQPCIPFSALVLTPSRL